MKKRGAKAAIMAGDMPMNPLRRKMLPTLR
jgi:hypothetical protein